MIISNDGAIPVEIRPNNTDSVPSVEIPSATNPSEKDKKVINYVVSWKNKLRQHRLEKLSVWNECWELYRGQDNFSNKEDWQSKIVLPKAWSSVKQATNTIKRFLASSKDPWTIEPINKDDAIQVARAAQMTELTNVFLDKACFLEEFATGLETGFIIGVGVWKAWWGFKPRTITKVEVNMVPAPQTGMQGPGLDEYGEISGMVGGVPRQQPISFSDEQPVGQMPLEGIQQNDELYPTQLPNSTPLPLGDGMEMGGGMMIPQRQIVQETIEEGQLFIRAVDPYNFYWLPGSKLNRWAGTIEEVEMPLWEVREMARGIGMAEDEVKKIQPMTIDESTKQSFLRFGESPRTTTGVNDDMSMCKLTEFYGPLIIEGEIIEREAHVIVVNDTILLKSGRNPFWHKTPPYRGFSPLGFPFRTDGIGLIEMVRAIDRALNRITNMSVDTLFFKLLPVFEVMTDAYENPEDFETGMHPGKIFRRNASFPQAQGLTPIQFEDISGGTIQIASLLDRSHQEGALVTELQQSLPRYRGVQTATETQAMQDNQNSFFGSMAVDIEKQAISPLIELAMDLVFQYLNTANDPRVASILGVGQQVLAAIPQPELMEIVAGDYIVKVKGISGQLEKAEMLQNLVQFMNLIGQNPQAWLPYLNSDKLLQRILEAFRPSIHDIESIIADPETVMANRAQMQNDELSLQLSQLAPQLAQLAQQAQAQESDNAFRQKELEIAEKQASAKGEK